MAVLLPDALPPEQGVAEELRSRGGEVASFGFQQFQVHLLGTKVLDDADIAKATQGAQSLSDVVRNLAALYYDAGYPAAQMIYALAEPDLYVLGVLGEVSAVEGDTAVTSYFTGLATGQPLRDSDLEPRRMLATMHSDRAAEQVSARFEPDPAGGGRYRMKLDQADGTPDPTDIKVEFGNPGNRFVGRHFLTLDGRTGFSTGDEISGGWRRALTGLNEHDDAEDFNEETLGWNRVTRLGIFGIAGANTDYTLNLGTTAVNGDLQTAEAAWLYPLAASFNGRWTINFKVDYTDKTLTTQVGQTLIQTQKYGSAEIGTAYSHAMSVGSLPLDLTVGLSVRKGMGDDKTDNTLTAADLGYLVFRPQAAAKLGFSNDWSTRLTLAAQITSDTLPEQSQWVMGGIGNASAYLPGIGVGDSGGLARWQIDYSGLGAIAGLKISPRLFAEYSYAKYENDIPAGSSGTPTVADAGIELIGEWKDLLEARLTYAESIYDKDLDDTVLDEADANLYFRLILKL